MKGTVNTKAVLDEVAKSNGWNPSTPGGTVYERGNETVYVFLTHGRRITDASYHYPSGDGKTKKERIKEDSKVSQLETILSWLRSEEK